MGFKNPGRLAGFLYVFSSLFGFFGLLYVPSRLIVHGDPAATAANITASESLFRLGIAANLIGQVLFIFVALTLYHLLKGVNPRQALAMLTLILVSAPIAMLNELNGFAALVLVRGADFLSRFDTLQRQALAMLFLNLRGHGLSQIAGVLWGVWLLPLGMLVYRSRFLPRMIGVFVVVAGCAYTTNVLAPLLVPAGAHAVSRWLEPVQILELTLPLWLLIKGVNRERLSAASPSPLSSSSAPR
jgi:hypothetical protein